MKIAATKSKAKCLEMLDRVKRTGEELVISKHGKPVASLIGEHEAKPWLAMRGKGHFVGDLFTPVVAESDIEALK